MNNDVAEQTGLKLATPSAPPKGSPTSPDRFPGERRRTQEEPSIQRLPSDQELSPRLTQNLCLLLADVVGSTKFYQKHGDVRGRLFIQRHHDTLAPLVAEYGGRVIKTIGDAIMASFEDPERALDSAISMQEKLSAANPQGLEDNPLQTKISLHYGSVLVEAQDVFGDLVNMSARLNDRVEPDQILISQAVYDHVKAHPNRPVLPLGTWRWKEGEQGLVVYEVLWQQEAGATGRPLDGRDFTGAYGACFYCGLQEHQMTSCPSKQLTKHVGWLDRLGYLPLPKILSLFQQQDLSTTPPTAAQGEHVFDAYYEISLPYQLRFLLRVWLATSKDWRELERQSAVTTSPLAGTRLWMGLDCLRVGRLDEAKHFLHAALDSNPDDYKPYVALGFWAMESADPFTALQYWRKALPLTTNDLQAAYLHLLMHRLYAINGKTPLAQQELHKALGKEFYLYEARYRRIALLVKEDKDDEVLRRVQKLIQDDRVVYLKVLLDPAFAPLQNKLHAVLSALVREARSVALDHMKRVTEKINALREWYQQPEAELVATERAVDRMRRHIKSESYFGYCDAAHEGEILQKRIHTLLSRRKRHLHDTLTTTLDTLQRYLNVLDPSLQLSETSRANGRVATLHQELSRLQSVNSFQNAKPFWRAWKDLQVLTTAVQQLAPSSQRHDFFQSGTTQGLRSVLLFGLSCSIIVDTALFGVLGYLVYLSRLRLTDHRLLVFLAVGALGGFLVGSAMGWLLRWYRS